MVFVHAVNVLEQFVFNGLVLIGGDGCNVFGVLHGVGSFRGANVRLLYLKILYNWEIRISTRKLCQKRITKSVENEKSRGKL